MERRSFIRNLSASAMYCYTLPLMQGHRQTFLPGDSRPGEFIKITEDLWMVQAVSVSVFLDVVCCASDFEPNTNAPITINNFLIKVLRFSTDISL